MNFQFLLFLLVLILLLELIIFLFQLNYSLTANAYWRMYFSRNFLFLGKNRNTFISFVLKLKEFLWTFNNSSWLQIYKQDPYFLIWDIWIIYYSVILRSSKWWEIRSKTSQVPNDWNKQKGYLDRTLLSNSIKGYIWMTVDCDHNFCFIGWDAKRKDWLCLHFDKSRNRISGQKC